VPAAEEGLATAEEGLATAEVADPSSAAAELELGFAEGVTVTPFELTDQDLVLDPLEEGLANGEIGFTPATPALDALLTQPTATTGVTATDSSTTARDTGASTPDASPAVLSPIAEDRTETSWPTVGGSSGEVLAASGPPPSGPQRSLPSRAFDNNVLEYGDQGFSLRATGVHAGTFRSPAPEAGSRGRRSRRSRSTGTGCGRRTVGGGCWNSHGATWASCWESISSNWDWTTS
jgi:hypothetical protein